MDHLLQDNPACIGYKNGEVPKPFPAMAGVKH
jgi:hypothetical protein